MVKYDSGPGLAELNAARRTDRHLYWAVGVFSIFANLLMLTGPIYMLQVFDRVLGSRSVATLVALTILVAFLYAMMGLLDHSRGRIMARVGARFQANLDRRVFDAVVQKSALYPDRVPPSGLRDLEVVQRLMTSPVSMAVFDFSLDSGVSSGDCTVSSMAGLSCPWWWRDTCSFHRGEPDPDTQPCRLGQPVAGKGR